MKKIYIIIVALFFSFSQTSFAQTDSTATEPEKEDSAATTPWDKANKAYNEGQYQVAEVLYNQLIESGIRDAAVYYNLGNVYFQQNQIGKAILNYKRAYLANPSDEDIQYNLELAQSKTKDKIDQVPSFFLVEWINAIRDLFNTNTWAELSIIILVIDLISILLWLLANSLGLRKCGFYGAIVLTILLIVSIVNSFSSANHVYNSSEAVVTSSAAIIKSSPSESGKDLFVVHEGTTVSIKQSLEGWDEVQLMDGNQGWIVNTAIEKVIKED